MRRAWGNGIEAISVSRGIPITLILVLIIAIGAGRLGANIVPT